MPIEKWNGDKVLNEVKDKVVANLYRACLMVEKTAKESMKGPSPSPPGHPPAVDTGRLRASITHEVDAEKLVGRVGSNINYALFLEIGTSRMSARPWLRPALEQERRNIANLFRK